MLDLIVSAITPPLLIVLFIYRNDLYEKEPHKLLITTFFLGCFLILPMILLELITEKIFKNIFIFSMIGVALVEEGIKYLALLKFNFPKKDFNFEIRSLLYQNFGVLIIIQ